jgi:hypothetical protein
MLDKIDSVDDLSPKLVQKKRSEAAICKDFRDAVYKAQETLAAAKAMESICQAIVNKDKPPVKKINPKKERFMQERQERLQHQQKTARVPTNNHQASNHVGQDIRITILQEYDDDDVSARNKKLPADGPRIQVIIGGALIAIVIIVIVFAVSFH